jgi:hypothetical protein
MFRFALILLIGLSSACAQTTPIRAHNSHGADHIRATMERCAIIHSDDSGYTECLLEHNATI